MCVCVCVCLAILPVQLEQEAGSMMGLIIKGGIDTPSQYIFIEDLVKGSMAETNGRLRRGDQIIMLGEECLVGMDSQQAQDLVTIANKKTKVSDNSTCTLHCVLILIK